MTYIRSFVLLVFASAFSISVSFADLTSNDGSSSNTLLEEIVVSGLRESPAAISTSSIAVLNDEDIRQISTAHFEELTHQVPNLNWSGGVSRPRYFQLRGIGERSQYEGAPDPSVGFIIDDMDFSAMGGIATTFDTEQIEVLRGPQGTRYGANALAGLIYVKYKAPSETPEAKISLSLGSDAFQSIGAVAGGALSDTLTWRVTLQNQSADGFRDNVFLERSDTNGRDELSARLKLRYQPNADWQLDLTTLHVDLDNGYDAFAVDNSFTTQSNRPGQDSQRSNGVSLRAQGEISPTFSLVSISHATRSDVVFSFDADWGNDSFWAPTIYDFFSITERDRENIGQEFRLVSNDDSGSRFSWVTGVAASSLRESNNTTDDGNFEGSTFVSGIVREYDARTTALFGDVDMALDAAWTLSAGLRFEQRDASYEDTAGDQFDNDESNVGGQVALRYAPTDSYSAYAKISRGFKAGGFNLGLPALADNDTLLFDSEHLLNYELGARANWLDQRLRLNATLFWMQRSDQQVQSSTQLDPNNPATFVFFTDNVGEGSNSGLEVEVDYLVNPQFSVYANVGLLKTEIDLDDADNPLDGRDQAHAPGYSFSLGGRYDFTNNIYARLDVTGKDSFFFSDSHDQESEAYSLVNMRVAYETEQWGVSLWARNLLDEEYAVRGFFFGNEPARDFAPTLYTRQGDPRQIGLSATYNFGR